MKKITDTILRHAFMLILVFCVIAAPLSFCYLFKSETDAAILTIVLIPIFGLGLLKHFERLKERIYEQEEKQRQVLKEILDSDDFSCLTEGHKHILYRYVIECYKKIVKEFLGDI